MRGPYKKVFAHGSEITYECRAGYEMNGEKTLKCTCQDGAWTHEWNEDLRNIKCTGMGTQQKQFNSCMFSNLISLDIQ